uniref:amidase family protein n=1 Tax=unclassified Pseudomonas TaxID=196821 RepID=UPI0030D77EBE
MRTAEYAEYDALGLAELIASGQVTQAEVSAAALSAIEQLNPKINALVEVWGNEPQAVTGPFKGVPFLVKDLGLTAKGHLNELGSRLAAGCIADEDSNLMTRLRQAGLVTIGRTTTPELAASTTTEAVFSGPTRNPWDLSRSAGGSSGGSAAAVAAGLVPAAHATDGGGSIRVPSASAGLFGLKSSRGRVSMGPAVDEVWAGLAVHGVVSRTVRDSAALLDAIEGVTEPLQTGLKVLDALIPIGRGQRELILGDRQTGKTAIALDTIFNQRDKNVLCVYCAIGQRASAVAKAVATLRAKGALAYTVVVVAEGNEAPGVVLHCTVRSHQYRRTLYGGRP